MAVGLGALRLLVIDDNAQMRSIIGTVLTAAGVGRLYYAQHGLHGLEIIRTTPIDVVYVDLEMPVMNGLDFVSAVRALDGPERYMPLIMLTGHAERSRMDQARDRGVTEFLCKPVTAKTILTRLNSVIMNPRQFVMSGPYFGPDRRRRPSFDYTGPRRRSSDG